MRILGVTLVAILGFGLPAAEPQQTSEEAAIRAVLLHETEGWDKFDAQEVASVFTADAIWQNPFGVRLHGRAEIEKFLPTCWRGLAIVRGRVQFRLRFWSFV